MITCTSEMSGSASSGMWPIDQIPVSVSSNTPVKTRNRLCAHRDLPGAAGTEIAFAFVHSVTSVARVDDGFHRGHSHGRHSGHEESHAHIRPRDWFSIF